ncbi:MAG TPA: AzlD domain-containing protein [Candidatus Limnocylindria bacterium]|nr:AzlD domain-containing protein [Candidatus Limnocylindria bacterium]
MTWELIAVLAAITYASRAASLVLLPSLPHGLRMVLDRMPAALFAGLAVHSVVVPGVGLVDAQVLAATGAAIVAAPLRSLPVCLVAGVAGYLLWGLIL